MDTEEEKELRAAALQNAQSILVARQKAERSLLAANEALERKTEELKQQREWFEVTLSSIGDGVITTDTQGRVTFMNPIAQSMTGWSLADALGLPLERVFHLVNEETRTAVAHPVSKALETQAIVALANRTALVGRHGVVIGVEDSAAPIRDTRGNIVGVVLVFHDVTARRRAEQALRAADRRKDEFLATLAHELRNPLAPIRHAALIAKAPAATDAQKRWSHDVISRQVQHMAVLLDDLLDISRITRGTLQLRPEMTELAAVIDAAVETARPSIEAKRHSFAAQLPEQPVHFAADPLRLAQILANLLTNAAKYTDAGGQIKLKAECVADAIEIAVSDTGVGIPAEALENVFEMFSQVRTSQERSENGLGIGLSLCRGLAQLHGGTITAHSAGLGQGSEFVVRLPQRSIKRARRHAPQAPAAESQVRRRVLIADDNRDAAETLAMLLSAEGHEVTVVHDGQEALDAFQTMQPQVALLDIGMPKISGYEVARRVRQGSLGRAVTLIAVTGWGQDSDKTRALAAGFNHHFTKPVEPERLSELLQSEEL
jgi:PAS domain S-box-containing protein